MLKCCQNDVDIMLEWCWQWCQNDAGMVPECFGDTTKMLSKWCQTDDKLMLERCQNHARMMLMSEWCWHAARIVLKLYNCQWIANAWFSTPINNKNRRLRRAFWERRTSFYWLLLAKPKIHQYIRFLQRFPFSKIFGPLFCIFSCNVRWRTNYMPRG